MIASRKMGRYGNTDGIATLTENTIAKDNVRGSIGRILAKREKTVKEQKNAKASSQEMKKGG